MAPATCWAREDLLPKRIVYLAGFTVLIGACSPGPKGDDAGVCIEGQSVACTCANGSTGAQVCLSSGTFGDCTCGDACSATGTTINVGSTAGGNFCVNVGTTYCGFAAEVCFDNTTLDIGVSVASGTSGCPGSELAIVDIGPQTCLSGAQGTPASTPQEVAYIAGDTYVGTFTSPEVTDAVTFVGGTYGAGIIPITYLFQSNCPATQCDGVCCASGDSCLHGSSCCPAAQVCLDACCATGDSCVGGACCAESQVCGSACCPSGNSCIGGACCVSADGATCCPADQFVCRGACCPNVDTCGPGSGAQPECP